jgi:iron(III) transport system substrate-binding protein
VTRVAAGLLAALTLCACERPATEPAAPAARPEPVVVYASYEDENYLPSLFTAFTAATGIPVTVRHRPEQQIVDEVIGKRGSPPADVLLTRSVHGVWQATDEGALRPLQSQKVLARVPGWLRDPDAYWTAIGFSPVRVVCNGERLQDCDAVEAYADLGKPELKGRLCLSASSIAVNRTLVAGLIADHGVRPAELIVRRWIANLALPPFESEAELLEAVDAGTCGLGVASGLALTRFNRPTVAASWPQPGYFDVVAVGINRHARSPEGARRLVEWLGSAEAMAAQFDAIGLRPVDADVPAAGLPFPAPDQMRHANVFGLYEADATKLAERARWY